MEKTFTVAGTSNLNGVVKFRFANDLKSRIAVLARNGHTEINLVELPNPMTKADAIAFLETQTAPKTNAADEAEVNTTQETAQSIRNSLEADGEDTSTMSDEFLAEVAQRENTQAE